MLEWTGRWGRYPAAGALFAFVALELAHPRPAYPRTLGIAIALYTYWALAGMAVYGRERVDARRRGLRGRVRAPRAHRAVRRSRTGASSCAGRSPGSPGPTGRPGNARLRRRHARLDELRRIQPHERRGRTCSRTCARTSQARRSDVADLATTLVNLGGLALFVAAVVVTYLAARGRGARARAGTVAHSSPTSSCRSSRSPLRTSSRTTSRSS